VPEPANEHLCDWFTDRERRITGLTCAYCRIFKLSQEILHVGPCDSEEIRQLGSIVRIKVEGNLFEVVCKGDGHDQPCARDRTDCLILDPRLWQHMI
jgi:hypothetical protein